MLKTSTMPADVLASDRYASSRKFQQFVQKAGLPAAAPIPMTIDWDVVRRELRGELPGVISTGDVVIGVNGPGKQSLDTNYLAQAEATGRVELLALHNVRSIARDAQGRWCSRSSGSTCAAGSLSASPSPPTRCSSAPARRTRRSCSCAPPAAATSPTCRPRLARTSRATATRSSRRSSANRWARCRVDRRTSRAWTGTTRRDRRRFSSRRFP